MADSVPENKYMSGYDAVKHHEWRTAENSAAYLLPVLKEKTAGRFNMRAFGIVPP